MVNPAASRGRAGRLWPRLEPTIKAAFPELVVRFTGRPGDAEQIALEWGLVHPTGTLLVAGGDGTLHDAVNALFRSQSEARLGVIPVGSGNDFARNAGIPLDPLQASGRLSGAEPRRVDLGQISFQGSGTARTRVFLNSVSLGLSVRANQLARALPRIGPARYRYGLAGALAALSGKPSHYRVTSGVEVLLDGPALNLTVANGACFGGGMRISPGSRPTDGVLELIVLGSLGRLGTLRALSQLQAGIHLALREVKATRLNAPVRVTGEAALFVEADGEELEADGDLTVTILPGRLAVLNASD